MRLLIFILIIFGAFFIFIKNIERKSSFFPDKFIAEDPSSFGIIFEDFYVNSHDGVNPVKSLLRHWRGGSRLERITSNGVRINGWFIPYTGASYTLLFCHGNAGNISHRLHKLYILRELGLNICIFDYRGFGRSQGCPSEHGIYKDAEAVYDYLVLQRKIESNKIILYGESLGTAVTVDLASKKNIGAMILEGSFSCGKDVGRAWYPLLPRFLFSDKFNSLKKIKNIEYRKLFIHAKEDEVIPIVLARKLFQAAAPPKEFIEIHGTHNDAFSESQREYSDCISGFIKSMANNR